MKSKMDQNYENDIEALNSSNNSFITFLVMVATFVFFYYWRRHVNQRANEEGPTEALFREMPASSSHVKSILNPFYIDVELNRSSLEDGVYFKVKTSSAFKSSFHVMVLWSVNINDFYKELEKNARESLYDEDYLDSICVKKEKLQVVQEPHLNEPVDNNYYYKTPEECRKAQEKRQNHVTNTYPVMIVLYRQRGELDELTETDIVASYTIVHLKDPIMESKVLYSYTKLLNNTIMNMNRLYEHGTDTCVVCLTAKSDQVLLPCKHVCTCSDCFQHLNNKCPICRGPVFRSFKANT